jgi:glycine cleavage system regulatory protein
VVESLAFFKALIGQQKRAFKGCAQKGVRHLMQKELVITFVGDDRPGIVQEMSQRVTARDGNWLESQMTRLAGKFAGVARVSVDETVFASLVEDMQSIPGISVLLEAPTDAHPRIFRHCRSPSILLVQIVPGILSEVSGALLAKGVNVVELETRVGPAPMTGDQTFFAEASILVPATVSMALLQDLVE